MDTIREQLKLLMDFVPIEKQSKELIELEFSDELRNLLTMDAVVIRSKARENTQLVAGIRLLEAQTKLFYKNKYGVLIVKPKQINEYLQALQ